jgi:hypothetical protein
MQNITVHRGSATPLSSRAGPRAPAISTVPADTPVPPISSTAARHCAAAHPSGASLRHSVRPARARAAHVARECRTRAAVGRRPPVRARPHGTPTPGTPHFSLLFPLCHAAAEPLALLHSSPLLSDPFSRVSEHPHRSLHPDRRLRPPVAPSPSWILAEHHRRPPLLGELLPELPIPAISCNLLTPLASPVLQDPTPAVATHWSPSPPTNAAARRRWHRLTVDPPFRCAPVLSSLPCAFPVTPRDLRQHLATVEPPSIRR